MSVLKKKEGERGNHDINISTLREQMPHQNCLKIKYVALARVAQSVGLHPVHGKVAGSIPSGQ